MRVLITGASGMLGAVLVDRLQNKFDVFGTGKSNFYPNPAKNFRTYNLLNNSYKELLEWSNPEVIIHCAAMTNVDDCDENQKQAMEVNARSLEKILQANKRARLIFISSDAVFPDTLYLASENDKTGPENIYGKSKEAGEKTILNAGAPHLAIRTTIIGKNINHSAKGFVEWILMSVKSGKKITLFYDALFTPITIWHLSDELEWIIENNISGIVHIAGTEPISKYEFGVRLCEKLSLNTDLIQKGSIDDFDYKAKRSKDQTLDSTYYQRLSGRELPSVKNTIDSIGQYFKEINYA